MVGGRWGRESGTHTVLFSWDLNPTDRLGRLPSFFCLGTFIFLLAHKSSLPTFVGFVGPSNTMVLECCKFAPKEDAQQFGFWPVRSRRSGSS